MRIALQRVQRASIEIDGAEYSRIGNGYLLLVGFMDSDDESIVERMAEKVCNLRIFADANGKTNLSISDVGGELLAVSQFTLYADSRKGHRPSFIRAGKPQRAETLYRYFVEVCRAKHGSCADGVFGGDMQIELVNDGPFTLWLDSEEMGYGDGHDRKTSKMTNAPTSF